MRGAHKSDAPFSPAVEDLGNLGEAVAELALRHHNLLVLIISPRCLQDRGVNLCSRAGLVRLNFELRLQNTGPCTICPTGPQSLAPGERGQNGIIAARLGLQLVEVPPEGGWPRASRRDTKIWNFALTCDTQRCLQCMADRPGRPSEMLLQLPCPCTWTSWWSFSASGARKIVRHRSCPMISRVKNPLQIPVVRQRKTGAATQRGCQRPFKGGARLRRDVTHDPLRRTKAQSSPQTLSSRPCPRPSSHSAPLHSQKRGAPRAHRPA